MAELVDMDYFVKYEAVSYFVGDPDDARNNYNNHYVYFLKSSGKAIFIPCDLDRTFGITKSYNPSGDAMVSISPYSKRAMGTGGEQQRNPLYIKTVCRGGYYVDEYTKALEAAFSAKTEIENDEIIIKIEINKTNIFFILNLLYIIILT